MCAEIVYFFLMLLLFLFFIIVWLHLRYKTNHVIKNKLTVFHTFVVHTTSKNVLLYWYAAPIDITALCWSRCEKDYKNNVKLVEFKLTNYLFTHYLVMKKQYLKLRNRI